MPYVDGIREEHVLEIRSLTEQMKETAVVLRGLHQDLASKADAIVWKVAGLLSIGGAAVFVCGFIWGSMSYRGGGGGSNSSGSRRGGGGSNGNGNN